MLRIVILLIGCAAGLAIIGYSLKPMRDARKAKTWPMIEATVVRSDVREVVGRTKKSGTNRSESVTRYQADVVYEYTVSGVKHTASRIDYTYHAYPAPDDLAPVLARFPEGATIRVYYNPDEPSDAVIEPKAETLYLFTYLGGFIAAGAAWLILKGVFRRERGVVP